jgi:hypothetical protein
VWGFIFSKPIIVALWSLSPSLIGILKNPFNWLGEKHGWGYFNT